jgi:hypothetical protein
MVPDDLLCDGAVNRRSHLGQLQARLDVLDHLLQIKIPLNVSASELARWPGSRRSAHSTRRFGASAAFRQNVGVHLCEG